MVSPIVIERLELLNSRNRIASVTCAVNIRVLDPVGVRDDSGDGI